MQIHPDFQASLRKVFWLLFSFAALLLLVFQLPPLPALTFDAPLHTALEIIAIVMSMMVAGVCRGAHSQHASRTFTRMAGLFLGVALLDLLYALSFPGMPTPAATSEIGLRLLIIGLYLGAAISLLRQMRVAQSSNPAVLLGAIGAIVLGELAFLLLPGSGGVSNLLVHFIKVAACAVIYHHIFADSLTAPYQQNAAARKKAEAIEANRAQVRTLVASTAPLPVVLDAVLTSIELQHEELLACFLLREPGTGKLGVMAPGRLPPSFVKALTTLPPDARGGDGALRAADQPPCYVPIQGDARWLALHEMARAAGLHGCWTEAIIATNGDLLGKLLVFRRDLEPAPEPREIANIHAELQVAVIVIDRRRTEALHRASEHRYRLLFEHSLDGVLHTRPDNAAILHANPAACAMFGMSEDELRDNPRGDIADLSDARLAAILAERDATGAARGETTMKRADGSRFEAELSCSTYLDEAGQPTGCVVIRDITERKRAEAEMNKLAFFDPLTRLPNRRLLMDRMALTLAKSRRATQHGAVLFIDLDHFKNINDARGHATGDALLKLVAQRLLSMLREEDTVARIGGDEFVVLASALADNAEAAARSAMGIAEKVREALEQPFVIDSQPYSSGGSIGLTVFPKGEQSVDDILREADTAMYGAKSAGRNRIAFFESTMQAEVETRFALEAELAQALNMAQLSMVLQPQFDHAGQPIGAELLMRWQHPQRGAISPAQFIPIAEETGLILKMGDWVLRQGCATLNRMREENRLLPLSINVSPRQFYQHDFIKRVTQILAETGAPAGYLVFEVTEGLLIKNLDDTIARMHELAALGIRFSIDDFGTGYSSLAYLRRMPLYELKIDRSFVQELPGNGNDAAIVQSILAMARHLRLRVIAEGVETREQADFLAANSCDGMQGYLLARPVGIDVWFRDDYSPPVNGL